jgi:hypothetical protein
MRVLTAVFGIQCRLRYADGSGRRAILCVTRWEPLTAGMLAWTGLTRATKASKKGKDGGDRDDHRGTARLLLQKHAQRRTTYDGSG